MDISLNAIEVVDNVRVSSMSRFHLKDFIGKASLLPIMLCLVFSSIAQKRSSSDALGQGTTQEQQSPNQEALQPDYSLRVYSQIVVLDVSVIDAKGIPFMA